MSQNRIIYQSEALYVSKSELSTSQREHKQLKIIQNVDYSFNIPREYINQYGQLGAIDSIVIASPTVSLNFSYYLTNLDNVNWIQPNSIDARNVTDVNGICFYSKNFAKFSGIIYGNSTFYGNSSPI